MFRLLLAMLLSAIAQMVWGFVFWTSLPITNTMMETMQNEEKVAQVLREELLVSGTYVLPNPNCDAMSSDDPEVKNAFIARHKEGPIVMINYRKEGLDVMSPMVFVMGFVHFALASLLAGMLLWLASPSLPSYFARLLFVTGLGLFATVALQFSNPIWFHVPWKFTLIHSGFDVVCWLLSGIILAACIRPRLA
jgi:hypothetical protein